jgi:endogenous inhibitor of DNA gyrase (YacG/DUF329 family)
MGHACQCGAIIPRASKGLPARRCAVCNSQHRRLAARRWPSRNLNRPCEECGRPRKRKGRPLCKACLKKQTRRLINCPGCGKSFWPWANGAHARRFCSRACAKRPKRAVSAKPPRPLVACAWCQREFQPIGNQRACNPECAKRVTCARKHARRRGQRRKQEIISLDYLYRRDRGVCGLCHRHVPRDLKAPHPQSATIDHIVPLSQGGRHVIENAQLAHYKCNTIKGNRPCGSQLRLVG